MKEAAQFKFRLYVTGDAHNSAQAIANLKELCRKHLPDRHEIEVVDVLREPKRALAEGVLLTPMLVKCSPSPVRRVIGNLSEQISLLQMLELSP